MAVSRTWLAALTVAAALAAGFQPASGVAPGPQARAALELDPPAPARIYEDSSTRLTGRLTNGLGGREIALWVKRPGYEWRLATTTDTDHDGRYAATLSPANPGAFLIRAERQGPHRELVSPVRRLQVLDRRVTLATRSSYTTFTTITVSGQVTPAAARRRVVIQRLVDGRWVSGAGGWTDADGRYSARLRHDLPGPWVVRAHWAGADPGHGTVELSPVHRFTVRATLRPVVTRVTRDQLGESYHAGCPVGPAALRNLTVTFRTFGPVVGRGTLVVRSTVVDRMTAAFGVALRDGYPVRRIFPTARYHGSDIASMFHDNTSAFNCRHVTGDPTSLSPHSYGTAIDVNPVENPYLDVHGRWWPRSKGEQFRDRGTPRPGMLYADTALTRAYTNHGFRWGGGWSHPDYQHFDPYTDKGNPASELPPDPLLVRQLPDAAGLGAGWSADGSARSRLAGEAGRQVLPLGCAHATIRSLPAPREVAQRSYRNGAAEAQALVMSFTSDATAAAYFRGLRSALAGCSRPDGVAGVAVTVGRSTGTSYDGVRSYGAGPHRQQAWRERDTRIEKQVHVLLINSGRSR